MTQDENHVFELEAFIVKDPFYQTYLRKREEESGFFYIHTDYFQYLQYLNIIWNRIREEYRTIGIYYHQEIDLLPKDRQKDPSREETFGFNSLETNLSNTLTILSCDIEAFVGLRIVQKRCLASHISFTSFTLRLGWVRSTPRHCKTI